MSMRWWQALFGSEPTYNPECDPDWERNPEDVNEGEVMTDGDKLTQAFQAILAWDPLHETYDHRQRNTLRAYFDAGVRASRTATSVPADDVREAVAIVREIAKFTSICLHSIRGTCDCEKNAAALRTLIAAVSGDAPSVQKEQL